MSEKPKRGRQGEGGGRPSPYAGKEIEISTAIAERLRTGEPLAGILRENNMPSEDAIEDWRTSIPEVERIIARARNTGFDAIAADCLSIADDSGNDYGEEGYEPEHVQRAKLRVETRLKLLAKWDPKRYGDQSNPNTVNLTNNVTSNTQVNVMTEDRQKALIEKKRESVERRLAKKAEVKTLLNGD